MMIPTNGFDIGHEAKARAHPAQAKLPSGKVLPDGRLEERLYAARVGAGGITHRGIKPLLQSQANHLNPASLLGATNDPGGPVKNRAP
jgi:hypothetical protein